MEITPELTRLIRQFLDAQDTDPLIQQQRQEHQRRIAAAANDYNLNISRYISTAVAEEAIDLAAVHQQLQDLETQIETATRAHNDFLKQLGLPPLP